MNRTTLTDAGSRYAVTIPLARELSEAERDDLAAALQRATFSTTSRMQSDDPIFSESVTVTEDAARVTATLALSDEHGPGELRGAVYRTVGEWASGRQPYDEPTRAGGETAVASLDAASLSVDRDPAGETHTVVLLTPERALTDEERAQLSAGLPASAVVTAAGVALFDSTSHVSADVRQVVQTVRQAVRQHTDRDAPVRTREFWSRLGTGTLATVDETAHEAVRERLAEVGPQTTDETEAEEVPANV